MTAKTNLSRWCCPKTILVATNLLEAPSYLEQVIHQSQRSGARVLLVHVARPACGRKGMDELRSHLLANRSLEPVIATLHGMAKILRQGGVVCDSVILSGNPAEQIPLEAKARNVDRVMVATRGASGAERLLTGSVAEELVAAIEVPVLVIGPHAKLHARPGHSATQILMATTFEPGSASRARFAHALAQAEGAQLTLLHVIDAEAINRAQKRQVRESARKKLESCLPQLLRARSHTTLRVEEGDPAIRILEVARSLHADLIVLGCSSEAAISRMLGNSIVYRVLKDADCPVMTLRNAAQPVHAVLEEIFTSGPAPAA